MYRCVHCGLCLSSCPTYLETDLETESPRGRIALVKAVAEGRLGMSPRVVSHWEMCLQCRACEAACPSGVPFGRLMEYTRAQVDRHRVESRRLRLFKGLFLRGVLPHPSRLRLGAFLCRTYQRWGARWLLRKSHVLKLLPGNVSELEAGMPTLSPSFSALLVVYSRPRVRRGRWWACSPGASCPWCTDPPWRRRYGCSQETDATWLYLWARDVVGP